MIDKWLISGVWLYRNQYIEHCWCLIQAFSRALNNEVSETEAGLPTDTDDDIRRKSHACVFLHTTRKERYCNAYDMCLCEVVLFCSLYILVQRIGCLLQLSTCVSLVHTLTLFKNDVLGRPVRLCPGAFGWCPFPDVELVSLCTSPGAFG